MKISNDRIWDLKSRIGEPMSFKELQQINKNQRLRAAIVDLADLWDGKESMHYGKILRDLLDSLGIEDIPEFYTKDNINKIIREMKSKRHTSVVRAKK